MHYLDRVLQKLLNLATFFRTQGTKPSLVIDTQIVTLEGTIRKISVATQHLTQQEEETLHLSLLLFADG